MHCDEPLTGINQWPWAKEIFRIGAPYGGGIRPPRSSAAASAESLAWQLCVAGNIANDDMLGSMEFACKIAGAKVALVMGHTACGAIKGVIVNCELSHLMGLLARIKLAAVATKYDGDRLAKNYAFVDAVARRMSS